MARKKNKHIVIIIFGIIILLAVLNWFGLFNFGNKLTIVPINNFPIETSSPYTCPLDVTQCKVQGNIECKNGGIQPTVIFRTNAISGNYVSGTWIAINCIPSGTNCITTSLNGYCYTSTSISSGVTNHIMFTPTSNDIGVYNSKIYVDNREFAPCTSADLLSTPEEPYTSLNCGGVRPCQELVLGSSYVYNCNGLFEVYDSSNNLKVSESIVYQSDVNGSKSSSQQTIYPGWKASLTSISSSNTHLYYGTYEEKEDCATGNMPKCNLNGTGFYNCKNGTLDKNNLTYCDVDDNGFVCELGKCTFPFSTKEINLVDSNRFIKVGFTPTEQIQITSKLISSKITSGDVNFKIFRYGETMPRSNNLIQNYNFQTGETKYVGITNPGDLGQYYVIVEITYNGKTVQLGANKEYSFRISSAINSNVNIRSPDRTSLFINSPIWIEVNTYNAVGPSEVDEIKLDVKFKGQTINIDPTSYERPVIESGGVDTYKFITQFADIGTLDVSAQVKKSDVWSAVSTMSKNVQSIKVITEFTNLDRFACIPKSTQTITFESKDSVGNYIDTTNSLKVIEPDTTLEKNISSLVERIETGKYKFTYNFAKESAGGNGYVFKLVGTSADYNIGSEPRSGTIEVRSGCTPSECAKNTDCTSKGIDYICDNGTCRKSIGSPDWLLYLGIGIGILVIIIVIVFVVKFKRNPSQNISTGLEGL